MEKGLQINEDKTEKITVEGADYYRWAIRTPLVTQADDLEEIVKTYAAPYLQKGDILFISEKMVACTQGAGYPAKSYPAKQIGHLSQPLRA